MDLATFSHAVYSEFNLDIRGYRKQFVLRRLRSRIAARSCASFEEYLALLASDSEERLIFSDSFSIPISGFNRDPWLFAYMAHHVLPSIVDAKRKENARSLRIWCAGCSAGQEAYSLAMILQNMYHPQEFPLRTFIFGTDIDQRALDRARVGMYKDTDLEHVTLKDMRRFFTKKNNRYFIQSDLRQMVHFGRHNLCDENPVGPSDDLFNEFDIVFCRNVLIYFEPEAQSRIFDRLHGALSRSGYLALGEFEHPPERWTERYRRCENRMALYQRMV